MTLDRDGGTSPRSPQFEMEQNDARNHARLLSTLRWAGWILIGIQFIGFLLWSSYLMSHASFGRDTAIYFQPWDLIAHGHLLPISTLQGGYAFWQNNGEFIVYLLAPLYWLFPDHLLGFLWLQDLALSGTIAVCYRFVTARWLRPEIDNDTGRKLTASVAAWLTILVLFLCNPWIYWVVSFDVHMETFGIFFIVCAFAAFQKRQRRGYVYAFATAICGAASVVYVFSLGLLLGAQWSARWYLRHRKHGRSSSPGASRGTVAFDAMPGVLLVIGSLLCLLSLSALHATQGDPTGGFAYLLGPATAKVLHITPGLVIRGVFEHPVAALRKIVSHGWNLWANTSASGLLGVATPVGLFMAGPALLLNNLMSSQLYNYPTFQNLPAFIFIALGTASLIAYLIKHPRTFFAGAALFTLVIVNEVGWFAVWFPQTRPHWVNTSAAAASVIWRAERIIPTTDEVVVANGVAGAFGDRAELYEFDGLGAVPIRNRVIWFVMSPAQGVEFVPTAVMERALGDIVALPGVKLVTSSQGVYVLRWQVPPRYRSVSLGGGDELDAWTTPGVAATPVVSGPSSRWYLASDGRRGDLLSGDCWREPSGLYSTNVRFSSTGPLKIEVWDDTTNRLLARARTARSPKTSSLQVRFQIRHEKPGFVYQGAAAFLDSPIPQSPGDVIEVKVWSTGTTHAKIWSVILKRD